MGRLAQVHQVRDREVSSRQGFGSGPPWEGGGRAAQEEELLGAQ